MADETEVLDVPVPKVELELSRWTTGQFQTRFQALTPVNSRRVEGVHKAEAKTLVDDMCEAITERDRALKSEADGGRRARKVAGNLRTTLRDRDEQIARLRGEQPNMGGLPVRAVAEVMGATRNGEHGAEVILADARRKAGLIVADARRLEDRATELLAQAEETAAAGPPELVLPDEPVDTAKKADWLRRCKEAIDLHRVALADYQATIDDRRAEIEAHQAAMADQERELVERQVAVLAKVDKIRAEVEAIDLTGETATGETERAAS